MKHPVAALQRIRDFLRKPDLRERVSWRIRAFLHALPGVLVETWQVLVCRWLRRAFGMLLLLAMGWIAFMGIQVTYGRFALVHQAGIAARQYRLKGEDRVILDLRRRAFALGFPEAALEEGAFRTEETEREGLELRVVSFDFIHRVRFPFGMACRIRIHGKAESVPMDPPASASPDLPPPPPPDSWE
jgi:hypothetical protein